jgi:hypothetical protein
MSVILALEALPTGGLTVQALQTLDRVVPGEWDNVTRFDAMVADICGPDAPPKLVAQVRLMAEAIERRDQSRFAQALQIYQVVDRVDQAAAAVSAAATAASAVKGLFGGFGSFGKVLEEVTPKPDTTQAVDAGLKLVAELLAFSRLHGLPSMDAEGIAAFANALADYGRYDLIRIAAWVVFDGVLPLGPDFMTDITRTWKNLATSALSSNGLFDAVGDRIPGDSVQDKQGFIISTLETTGDWVNGFVQEKGLTQGGVMQQLDGLSGLGAGSMDMVAAAIDASTNITAHTGTQTVARALAREGHRALREKVWTDYVAALR